MEVGCRRHGAGEHCAEHYVNPRQYGPPLICQQLPDILAARIFRGKKSLVQLFQHLSQKTARCSKPARTQQRLCFQLILYETLFT